MRFSNRIATKMTPEEIEARKAFLKRQQQVMLREAEELEQLADLLESEGVDSLDELEDSED